MAGQAKKSRGLLWLTILAAPAALAVETGLRKLIFPFIAPEFETLVRPFLEPLMTPVAWGIAGFDALAAVAGLALQARVTRRRLLKLPPEADEDMRFQAAFGVFLLTTAVPQIPAILSTFAYMFGASIVPTLVAIGVCSAGVVGQALRVPSFAERA